MEEGTLVSQEGELLRGSCKETDRKPGTRPKSELRGTIPTGKGRLEADYRQIFGFR